MSLDSKNKTTKTVLVLTIIFLAIELLDELVDGVGGAAYPLIRNDLHLSYVQVGLLLTIPNTISSLIEPILGILGDLGQRRQLILGGGVAFAFALLLISLSHHFYWLLVAFVLFYPASGSFVSLSQATLMDSAMMVLCLYPAFLVVPNLNVKLIILGLLGFLNAGWYSILQGRLYTAMPGQSGTVMTLNNLAGFVGGLAPFVLGWVAQHYGLQPTMWMLLAAPIALLVGLFKV